jgi:CheY-like chemotaxis protein
MDGWAAIEAIKVDTAIQHIPIIVVSVEVYPSDRQKAFALGCDMYYPKPFSVTELLNIVAQYANQMA